MLPVTCLAWLNAHAGRTIQAITRPAISFILIIIVFLVAMKII
jgi:hypothetical protein